MGKGCPRVKSGNELHRWSRLLGLIDVYLTLQQPMKSQIQLSPADAIAYLIFILAKAVSISNR